MPNRYCDSHISHTLRIERLETEENNQWKKLDNISTKLNLVLGGIFISPFLVGLISLLIKVKL